ncbi:MAG: hypothetical protein MJ054_01690 [Clostridia bacterium]|nr:hypothetical protein [Clostridia bacterium]
MKTYHVRVFNEAQTTKFDSELDDLKTNEYVIVETPTGAEWGVVADEGTNKKKHEPNHAQIFRRATTKDQSQINLLLKSAEFAKEKATAMAEQLKLDMRIMTAHYTFDASKVVIDFSAEQRVDFREMVRNLASTLHTRIELHQIGARDEVKTIGALGPCGQECCCKRFCHNYPDVSIKMAKQQNLSLTPEKINGICGRLKCCLSYESDKC